MGYSYGEHGSSTDRCLCGKGGQIGSQSMWKWVRRIVLAAFAAGGLYTAYDGYRAGYHTRPKMPEGAFSLSYKSGLRAILVDVPDDRETRRYFGFPSDVPFYVKDAWSFCAPPTEEEAEHVASVMNSRNWPGERFEAICKIKVDSDVVVRGIITSVPKL